MHRPQRPVAPTRLRLSQISFGKLDARYEVLTREVEEREHFKASFLEPSGLSVDEFLTGGRYFVHGMKGSGKTAFLRYLQLSADGRGCLTKFVSFATDITESERARLASNSGMELLNQDDIEIENSAINFWMLFIFRSLVDIIDSNKKSFSTHRDINLLVEIVKRVYDGGMDQSTLKWLSSILKSGKYKLKNRFFEINLRGNIEKETDYPIDVIISKCCSLLRSLSFEGPDKIFIFYDELNLSLSSKAQHRRDAVLIRDLVLAVDRINAVFIESEKPVFLMAAIRSEVLNAMNTPTHEINKMLTDKGRELRWFARTAGKTAPINALIERKIAASESAKLTKIEKDGDVWSRYFHNTLFHMNPKDFVVEITWCNPRDLVMLFGKAATEAGNDHRFDESNITKVLDQYSSDAWREKVDELNVEYAQTEIQAIKKILVNFKKYFRADEFGAEAQRKGGADQNVKQLSNTRKVEKILGDLYRIGVLGQSSKVPADFGSSPNQFNEHWAYRGDQTFDPKTWMVVHRALWPELRLGNIRPNRSQ